jgi:hypothetical protein
VLHDWWGVVVAPSAFDLDAAARQVHGMSLDTTVQV